MVSQNGVRTTILARRLLEHVAAAGAEPDGGFTLPATARVCDKLRRPLSNLAGVTGFSSLLARALTLAKREDPVLNPVQPGGSLDGIDKLPPEKASAAGILLIAQLIGLLVAFIGESLTLSILHDVWQDLTGFEEDSGGKETR
jgi:hypothetical protein